MFIEPIYTGEGHVATSWVAGSCACMKHEPCPACSMQVMPWRLKLAPWFRKCLSRKTPGIPHQPGLHHPCCDHLYMLLNLGPHHTLTLLHCCHLDDVTPFHWCWDRSSCYGTNGRPANLSTSTAQKRTCNDWRFKLDDQQGRHEWGIWQVNVPGSIKCVCTDNCFILLGVGDLSIFLGPHLWVLGEDFANSLLFRIFSTGLTISDVCWTVPSVESLPCGAFVPTSNGSKPKKGFPEQFKYMYKIQDRYHVDVRAAHMC